MLLALAILVVLIPALFVFSLRTQRVRVALLNRVAASVQASTGVRATARDFTAVLHRGELEIEDLALAANDEAPPFLIVPRTRAKILWRSLLSGPVQVQSLRLEEPRLDLGAPLPARGRESDASGQGPPAFEIVAFTISGGSIGLGEIPGDLEIWLDAMTIDAVEARGGYRSGDLDADSLGARIVAESRRRDPIALQLEASGSMARAETIALDTIRLVGDGLELEGTLAGPLTASGNLEASVDLAADLAQLFPDLTSAGHVEARGKLALQRTPETLLSGALKVDAREFPAELLGPWIDAPGPRALQLADTHLDANAEVEVAITLRRMPDTATENIVRGSAQVVWRRAELPLLTASVLSSETEPSGVRLEVDARLLPRAAGERVVRGVLTATSWSAWTDAELRKTHVELDFPDLATAAEQLGLDADEIRHWPLVGFLHAELDARGPLTHPDLRFVGAWDHDGQRLIDASAESLSGEGAGPARPVRIEIDLLPGEPGRRHLSGSFLPRPGPTGLQGELDDMHLVVELPDLKRAAEDMLRRYRTLFAELPLPEGLERFVGTSGELSPGLANGSLVAKLAATGPLTGPNVELDAVWVPAAGERVRLEAEGILSAIAPVPSGQGRVRLGVEQLDLGRIQPWLGAAPGQDDARASSASDLARNGGAPAAMHEIAGRVSGSVELEGDPRRWAGDFRIDGEALRFGEYPGVDRLRIEGRSDGEVVELSTLSADLERRYPAQGAGRLEGRGSFDAVWPPGRMDVRVELTEPLVGLERATANLRLEEATLYVDPLEVEAGGELAILRAVAPLDALLRLAVLQTDPPLRTGDLSAVSVELENWKVGPFLALLDEERGIPGLTATIDGSLAFDRLDVASIRGRVDVSDLEYEVEGETVEAGATLRFQLGEGKIKLPPTRLQATGSPIDGRIPLGLSGSLELARDWQPEQGVGALITGLTLELEGAVELSLLNPFLAGGVASGTAAVDARAKGRFDALTANARLSGPEASLLWISPYATKFESPEIDLHVEGDRAELKTARATLNGGSCELRGSLENGNLKLAMSFDRVRYRLNFGVVAVLGGRLELDWPSRGRRRLSGEVIMQRGVLRRDIRFGRHLLDALSGSTSQNPILDTIELNLRLTTDEGLNIDNNLATLRADWDRVDVRGTLAEPRLTGRIEVDPGGRITLLGEVYRIDEGALKWSDEPASQPAMLFETTSSLEDPTLKQEWRKSGLEVRGPGEGGMLDFWDSTPRNDWEAISNGMMSYYQSMLAGGLSSGLDKTTISFEQLPIFGETDTQARFTVSYEVSPNVTFIASSDPRQAQAQTYIVDLHGFALLPNMRAQVFTNDSNNGGLTLQHTLKFGAGTKDTVLGPRVRRVHVEPVEGVSRRRVRRAVDFRKGDPFPRGASLDVEVDVAEALSRRGFPLAGVGVTVEEVADQKVELGVAVNPGPRIQFAFEGEKLPKSTRRRIVAPYRPLEIGQEQSVENLRTETIRALRSRGFIEPQVEVIVEPLEEGDPQGGQKVRVASLGGRRVDPGPPLFDGIAEADAQELAASFPSVLSRIELALDDPAADRLLQRTLDDLGYPRAQVDSRELSDDGERLLVRVVPGPQRKLARIELAGVDAELVDPIAEANGLIVGKPVRSGQVGNAVDEIEAMLQADGHAEAKARGVLDPLPGDESVDVVLRLEVDAGPRFRIDSVRFEGLQATRRKWAERRAGIEAGELLNKNELSEARRRLSQSGVFRRIRIDTDSRSASTASGAAEPSMSTTVTFDVDEAPRYWLSYGGRWESDLGLGVVVDVVDRNSLGRGHASGIRGIYGSRLKSLRLYHVIPRFLHTKNTFEVFVEGKREAIDPVVADSVQTWFQYTIPLGRRSKTRFYTVFENRKLSGDVDNAPPDALDQVISPRFGWQWAFSTLDRQLGVRRRKGLFFGLDYSAASTRLGSDVTSLALFNQLKLFVPFGSKFTWAQSYRTGWAEAKDQPLPFADRLRAGGSYSVRGYPSDSLGPLTPEGVAIGGEVMLIINQEIHRQIIRSLGALVFFDAGNVWESRSTVDSKLFKSIGAGARYYSPIGPLRLDVAYPMDRREGDPSYKIYLGFGEIF